MSELLKTILLLGDRGHEVRIRVANRMLNLQLVAIKNDQRYTIERCIGLIELNNTEDLRRDWLVSQQLMIASNTLRDRMP